MHPPEAVEEEEREDAKEKDEDPKAEHPAPHVEAAVAQQLIWSSDNDTLQVLRRRLVARLDVEREEVHEPQGSQCNANDNDCNHDVPPLPVEQAVAEVNKVVQYLHKRPAAEAYRRQQRRQLE